MGGEAGPLAAGRQADVVVVEGDPLADLRTLTANPRRLAGRGPGRAD